MEFFFLRCIDWFMEPVMNPLFRFWIALEKRRQNIKLIQKSTHDVFRRLEHAWKNRERQR